MSTKQYDALEGTLTVRGTATSSRSGATNAVAIVGGYDANNASNDVTAGEATFIDDPNTAEDTFGDSELPRAAQAVSANGVGDIYGVPLPETNATESFSSTQSGTLAEAPVMDPTLHPDEEITATDTINSTDFTVNITRVDSVPTPSDSETVNINPRTGEWEASSTSDFEITYTHGEYTTPIEAAADLPVRYVIVGTEADSVKATLVTELNNVANDFDFKRGVVNAHAEIATADIGSYEPSQRDWRLVETAPALASGADGAVRSCYAVGGLMAAQPIGPTGSGLYDDINGLTSLNTEYRASQAKSFEGVTAITRNGRLATAETTSSEGQFRLVYATEIIDDVALDLFDVARDYAGGPQDVAELETLLEVTCESNASGSPPNLGFAQQTDADPYDVNVTLGASDTVANAGVTIVPYPIAEEVNINLTVSDGFVEFEGAN